MRGIREEMMVDALKRKRAVDLIRRFIDGQISNDEYDNDFPDDTQDQGLLVVYDRLWLLYSDLRTHRLDKDTLSSEERELIERCITFLNTDLEYEGPPLRERKPISGLGDLFRRLSPNKNPYSLMGEQSQKDSVFVTRWWPFTSVEQYQQHSPKVVT
jgi:hypothetical protein